MDRFGKIQASAFAVLLILIAPCAIHAQDSTGLATEELQVALAVEEQAIGDLMETPWQSVIYEGLTESLEFTFAAQEGKSVVTTVALAGSPSTRDAGQARHAIVTRFDYRTSSTFRTTVDLEAEEVVALERKLLYPTPLADSERALALEIAREARSDWRAILENAPDEEIELTILVPVDSNHRSPTYGHRLVRMRIVAPERSEQVLIDLSLEELVEE